MDRQTEAQHLRLLFDRFALSAKLELAKGIETSMIDILRGEPGYLRAASAKSDESLIVACLKTRTDSNAVPRMVSAAIVLRLCIAFRESGDAPADKVSAMLLEYANLDQGIDLEQYQEKRAQQPRAAAKKPRRKKAVSPEQVGAYFGERATEKHANTLMDAATEFKVSEATISRRLQEWKKLSAVTSDAKDVTK